MRQSPKLLALVFLGGALGTLLRYAIGSGSNWIISVVIVNLAGAAFLGFVNGSATKLGNHFSGQSSRAFWGAGFAGGFTTMSGLAGAFVMLNILGLAWLSAIFMAGQLILGVLIYWAALRLFSAKPIAVGDPS